MLKNKIQIFITVVYLSLVAWWLSFQSVVENQGLSVQRFGYSYGIMALLGAVIGFWVAKKWGGYKTIFGKALLFFSFGLMAQELGQIIVAYYVYVSKIQIPYPSWGDLAYFSSTIFYILGGVFLAKAVGVKFSLKSNKYKMVAFAVPAAMLVISFWVFMYHHEYDTSHPLTVFLDFGYPIGDAIYISMAIIALLLSRKALGGVMRIGVLVLVLALIAQYAADFSFLYQSSRGTFLGGKWVDLLYLTSYFVMATAMVKSQATYNALRTKSVPEANSNNTKN